MSAAPPFIAVDWGTTNRRTYLMAEGVPLSTERDDKGAANVEDFVGEVAAIRARFGDLPILLAGMVGSTIGWRPTPYCPTPTGIDDLAAALVWIDQRTAVVPGVRSAPDAPADVMRGEEVQLLGAVEAGLAPERALLVQPGTHCKWAELTDRRITGFTTAMTGELFALLRAHSLLRSALGAEVRDGAAYRDGVKEGQKGDLAASLFAIRAASLLGARNDEHAASYASGILIGNDVTVRLNHSHHRQVHILADRALGQLYATAIEMTGATAVLIDSHAAFAAGVAAIAERVL